MMIYVKVPYTLSNDQLDYYYKKVDASHMHASYNTHCSISHNRSHNAYGDSSHDYHHTHDYSYHVPTISYASNDAFHTQTYYTSSDDRQGHYHTKLGASHPITSSAKYHSKIMFINIIIIHLPHPLQNQINIGLLLMNQLHLYMQILTTIKIQIHK